MRMSDDSFNGIQGNDLIDEMGALSITFEDLSNMIPEALVILDFQQNTFLHVPCHDLFLCGYSQEEVRELGFKFFKKALHPEDIQLWNRIYNLIFKSQNNGDFTKEKINYFSFTLRFKSSFSKGKKNRYNMVYFKLKLKFIDEEPRFGICFLSCSVMPNSGNLNVYFYNQEHAEYAFDKRKWMKNSSFQLTGRERELLMWTQQGLSQKEIAEKFGVEEKTVENSKYSLFRKIDGRLDGISEGELEIKSIIKALQYASNRRLIFQPTTFLKAKKLPPLPPKKKRKKMTEKDHSDIQIDLNRGKSVNSISIKTGIPESTIRKVIKSRKLTKNSQ